MELNKENLERCYLIERLSTRKCADIFKISQSSIRSSMKKWEIKGRSYKENIMPNPKGSHLSDSHKEKISLHHKNDKNWHMRGRSGELHHNYTRVEKNCAFCGKIIFKQKCHSGYKHSFCSSKCHGKWMSKNLIGKNSPSFTSVKVKCSWCGKEIEKTPYRIANSKNLFCCRKHCGLWKAQNLRGDKIYNWKGGYMPYYGENWLSQRRLALKRDNYTCQKCGKTKDDLGKNPDVHHKKSFRKFGLENYIQANDLNNLICLCGKCHSRMHNKSK
jgi:5-methylcytosine-specific restriction endonuclease McrA